MLCHCRFVAYRITNAAFDCFTSLDKVTFRAVINGNADTTSLQLLDYIKQWVGGGAKVPVQGLRLTVDPTCPVEISSIDDPECEAKSTDEDSNNTLAIISGSVASALVVVTVMVVVALVIILVVKRHHSGTPRLVNAWSVTCLINMSILLFLFACSNKTGSLKRSDVAKSGCPETTAYIEMLPPPQDSDPGYEVPFAKCVAYGSVNVATPQRAEYETIAGEKPI